MQHSNPENNSGTIGQPSSSRTSDRSPLSTGRSKSSSARHTDEEDDINLDSIGQLNILKMKRAQGTSLTTEQLEEDFHDLVCGHIDMKLEVVELQEQLGDYKDRTEHLQAAVKELAWQSSQRNKVLDRLQDKYKPKGGGVVGVGVAVVDLLAEVEEFPKEDQKVVTKQFNISPGGNAFASINCCGRQRALASLISKIGNDDYGATILQTLRENHVQTRHLVVKSGMHTPFSYVVVARKTKTRTIIHTPSEQLEPTEIDLPRCLFLKRDGKDVKADLLLVDGRYTRTALAVARCAVEHGIPLIMDCEKPQGSEYDELFQCVDYLVTNTDFPGQYTSLGRFKTASAPSADLLMNMQRILELSGKAKWIISTLGAKGSVMLTRIDADSLPDARNLEDVFKLVVEGHGEEIFGIRVVKFAYVIIGQQQAKKVGYFCSALPLASNEVVDTTGAGDVFVGSIAYCVAKTLQANTEFSPERAMRFASFVAGAKCRAVGGVRGVPLPSEVPSALAPF